MINHRRGNPQQPQQQPSSRFTAAVAAGLGSSSKNLSTSGSSCGCNSQCHSNSGSSHGPHKKDDSMVVSPLMDNCSSNSGGSCGSIHCSGGASASASSVGPNPLLGGMSMPSVQTIRNGFSSRRKRSTPILTEDRLMSLLLILIAVWFLYVRYEEAKAFENSQMNAANKRGSRYRPSDEYLAALNMEKKRDYDAHLNRAAALNAASHQQQHQGSGGGGFDNIRLYPDNLGDDDSFIESGFSNQYSNLRGSEFPAERDTGVFTPSEIRLKMVQHGGLDTGGFGTSVTNAKKPQSHTVNNKKKHPTSPESYPEFEEEDENTKSITQHYHPVAPVRHQTPYDASQSLAAQQTIPHTDNTHYKPRPASKPQHTTTYVGHKTSTAGTTTSVPAKKPLYVPKRHVDSDPTKNRREQVDPISSTFYTIPKSVVDAPPASIPPTRLYIPKRARENAKSAPEDSPLGSTGADRT